MAYRRLILLLLLTAGALALALPALLRFPPLLRAEMASGEWIARHGRRQPADPKLIFLAIDSDSMLDAEVDLPDCLRGLDPASPEAEGLRLMAGKWPWSRRLYALVLDRLAAAGVRAVAFDLNFPVPTADDDALRAALDRHRQRVVIGGNFLASVREQGAPAWEYVRPAESILAHGGQRDGRLGFVNFWAEADGAVRSAVYTVRESELNDHAAEEGEEQHFSLAAQVARQTGAAWRVPAEATPRVLRFAAAGAYARRSLYEIFAPEHWQRNCGSGAFFHDAIVVVGASGNWQHDEHLTTLGVLPGPEIQLNAIDAVLHDGFIRPASPAQLLLCLEGAAFLSALLTLFINSPLWRMIFFAAVVGGWIAGARAAYDSASLLLPTAAPLLLLSLNTTLGLLYDFALTRRERRRVRSTLERYVSRNVVREMIENPREFAQVLGGAVRPVTVLFSDIRNFTRHCAQTDPVSLVRQLNEYLTAMVECAFAHGGTLDKFIGDAVMVVWGNARTDGPAEDARQAVRCALAMQQALERLNAHWAAEGRLPIEIGVALNHGRVVAGNIGSPHRMEFTVMGDAVNVCWRLQERTKLHGGAILLGETMLPLLGAEFHAEPAGEIVVGETLEVSYAELVSKQNSQPVRAGCQTAGLAGVA